MNRGLVQHHIFYDRLFELAGYACISIQLRHRPPVASSPDLPLHMTIPASVFQPGKDRHDTRQVWPSLQSLVRRLCLVSQPTLESLQTLVWQWWMSLPKRPRDFNTLRKHLQSDRSLLNISKRLLRELLAALPGFRPALEEYCQSSTVITVPRTFLWKCFELLDLQLQQQHLITRNRDETTRSRGLGTNAPCGRDFGLVARELYFIMVRFWTARATSARLIWTCRQHACYPQVLVPAACQI